MYIRLDKVLLAVMALLTLVLWLRIPGVDTPDNFLAGSVIGAALFLILTTKDKPR